MSQFGRTCLKKLKLDTIMRIRGSRGQDVTSLHLLENGDTLWIQGTKKSMHAKKPKDTGVSQWFDHRYSDGKVPEELWVEVEVVY